MTKWKKENSRAVDFKSALTEGLKRGAWNLNRGIPIGFDL